MTTYVYLHGLALDKSFLKASSKTTIFPDCETGCLEDIELSVLFVFVFVLACFED